MAIQCKTNAKLDAIALVGSLTKISTQNEIASGNFMSKKEVSNICEQFLRAVIENFKPRMKLEDFTAAMESTGDDMRQKLLCLTT